MITFIHLELLRIVRDRRYWFWALIGVPILLPAVLVLAGFSMVSFGTVEPPAVRTDIVTNTSNSDFIAELIETGISIVQLNTRDEVQLALIAGKYTVGLVDVKADPGESMSATLLAPGHARGLPIYRELELALESVASSRRKTLIDELSFDGPSFDILSLPLVVSEERVPDRLKSGLMQIVTLTWCALLLFPYLLLTWSCGSRVVTDRMSGHLSPLNASSMPPWKWLVARWCALSIVGGVLLLVSVLLYVLYMRAFGTVADMIVAQGALEHLSEGAALKAKAYLVDAVAMWRGTSFLSLSLWLCLCFVQLATACALVLWGSVRASSLAQYRLFELLPFMVVFVVPMMNLGALGNGMSGVNWLPGLNTVLTIQHVVAGGLPGIDFFASMGAAMLSNLLTIAIFMLLGVWALRNERLWSV